MTEMPLQPYIGAVVLLAASGWPFIAQHPVSAAEFDCVRLTENVAVDEKAVAIEMVRPGAHSFGLGVGENLFAFHLPLWTDNHLSGFAIAALNHRCLGKYGQHESEESYGVASRLLPKGFALLCLAAGVLSGIVTGLIFYFGGRVRTK